MKRNRFTHIPTSAGVFVVWNERLKQAYVGRATNRRARAAMWAQYFKNQSVPVKGFPQEDFDNWAYDVSDATESDIRARLEAVGYKIINSHARKARELYEVGGITATVPEHAKRLGVQERTVYRRLKKGYTIWQALGVEGLPTEVKHD